MCEKQSWDVTRQARPDSPGTLHHMQKNNIKIDVLYYGGRRRNVSFARAQAARILIEDFGITLAEVARNLGVSFRISSMQFLNSTVCERIKNNKQESDLER